MSYVWTFLGGYMTACWVAAFFEIRDRRRVLGGQENQK